MSGLSDSAVLSSHRRQVLALGRALSVISGKWKVPIICELFGGTRRYGELRKSLSGITQCVLTSQLRELQRVGVVSRRVYPTTPPAVEYSLTARGEALQAVFQTLRHWAESTEGQVEPIQLSPPGDHRTPEVTGDAELPYTRS
jgi:DNA-binding HxlR family transcriptional regulator